MRWFGFANPPRKAFVLDFHTSLPETSVQFHCSHSACVVDFLCLSQWLDLFKNVDKGRGKAATSECCQHKSLRNSTRCTSSLALLSKTPPYVFPPHSSQNGSAKYYQNHCRCQFLGKVQISGSRQLYTIRWATGPSLLQASKLSAASWVSAPRCRSGGSWLGSWATSRSAPSTRWQHCTSGLPR